MVAAYGLILPQAVLDAPRLGCVNIHASLLPRWRGASPIQHAILAGDAETGITIMQMDAGLDTGPILMQEAIPIPPTATAAGMHDLLAYLGAQLIGPALDGLDLGTLTSRPQPDDGRNLRAAPHPRGRRTRLDAAAPRRCGGACARSIRGRAPGSAIRASGSRCWRPASSPTLHGAPGTVLADPDFGALVVACGAGALRITHLQREGKPARDAADFLRGFPLPPGMGL